MTINYPPDKRRLNPPNARDVFNICLGCQKPYQPRTKHRRKFCSAKCRDDFYRQQSGMHNWTGVDSNTTGVLSELRATIDLLVRGYEVFRAVSPAASCDLAILKDGRLFRVQVRTAYKRHNGKIYSPWSNKDSGRYDIFASVLRDEIIYDPKLP